MAKILSEAANGRIQAPQPSSADVHIAPVVINFEANASANDIVSLVTLPPGVRLVDYTLVTPDLGGTPAVSIGVENEAGTDLATVYEAGLVFTNALARGTKSAAAFADSKGSRKLALKLTANATASKGKSALVLLHLMA